MDPSTLVFMSFAARGRALGFVYGCAVVAGCGAGDPFGQSQGSGGSGGGGRTAVAGEGGTGGGTDVAGRLGNGGAGGAAPAGGSLSLGGAFAMGGAPGVQPGDAGQGGTMQACDDGNACTVDVVDDGKCAHEAVTCAPEGECRSARCDPKTGKCVAEDEADGAVCDDGNVCTTDDGCGDGVCVGAGVGPADVAKRVMLGIPDGKAKCGGVSQSLEVVFEIAETPATSTNAAAITIELDLEHTYVSELEMVLRHAPSGRRAHLFEYPMTPNVRANGVFTFKDDAPPYPLDLEAESWPAGAYAPVDSLTEAFDGVPAAGTWTLTISDRCGDDAGFLRAARLEISPTCPD